MKTERIGDMNGALRAAESLPFAYVRTLSSVYLGKNDGHAGALETPDELIEARFFDESTELRAFCGDGGMSVVRLSAESGDAELAETYRIENDRFGGAVSMCRLLAADCDGQTYIAETRLTGWKGAKENA